MNATKIVEDFFNGMSPLIKQKTAAIKKNLLQQASKIDISSNEEERIKLMRDLVKQLRAIDETNTLFGNVFKGHKGK